MTFSKVANLKVGEFSCYRLASVSKSCRLFQMDTLQLFNVLDLVNQDSDDEQSEGGDGTATSDQEEMLVVNSDSDEDDSDSEEEEGVHNDEESGDDVPRPAARERSASA